MSRSGECNFCRIIRGEAPAEVLYRCDEAIAILDIRPIHFGHILVIPARHCDDFLAIPDDLLAGLMSALKTVTAGLVSAIRPDGFNIFSNNGAAAGQSVFHFHFHVTPRYAGDDIRFVLTLKRYGDGQMSEYGEKIRKAIAATSDIP